MSEIAGWTSGFNQGRIDTLVITRLEVGMKLALAIIEIILSITLIAVILLQQRGSGLGDAFGGGSGGGVYRSKRGIEKLLHRLTIFIAFLFVAVAIANLFVR